MIKGKFVATVEINITVDENTPNLLPFDELKRAVQEEICVIIQNTLDDEFSDIGNVKITQQSVDLWKMEEAMNDETDSN